MTQAGRGGLLFRLLVQLRCREGLALLSPLCCSCSRLLYMKRALHCTRFQPSGVPQKHGLGLACVLCLPCPSGSRRQELDGRTLPGCGTPSPLHGPSLSFHPRQSGAFALCPPRPQPQSPSVPVGCLCPVSHHDPPGRCLPSRISGSLWLETGGLFEVR